MNRQQRFVLANLLVAVLLCGVASVAKAARFQGLGFLPGGVHSEPFDVSADGNVVVGFDSGSRYEAFRWDATSGIVGLGRLSPINDVGSFAHAVNADGSVVVGLSANPPEAFRWDAVNGMVAIADDFWSADDVSAYGSIIVGMGIPSGVFEAIRWDEAGGAVGLGFLPGYEMSHANAVNADGSVVVGYSFGRTDIFTQAFRWDSINGMVALGFLPGHDDSFARDISGDGSVIVGESRKGNMEFGHSHAFRWDAKNGMVALGFLPGDTFSWAEATNANGSVIVGTSGTAIEDWKAFIWDSTHGMQNLQHLLVNSHGLDLTGWTLLEATAISADGRTIVGRGISPNGYEAWIAVIPEPASLALAAVFLPLAAVRRGMRLRGRVFRTWPLPVSPM